MSRFLLIPQEILTNRNLLGNEKIVLTQLYNFCKDGKECFASNEYLSVTLGINEKTLDKILDNLERYGLISTFAGKKNIHFDIDSIKYFVKPAVGVAPAVENKEDLWQNSHRYSETLAEKSQAMCSPGTVADSILGHLEVR